MKRVKKKRKKKNSNWRNLLFLLLSFGGFAVLALLIAPPWGIAAGSITSREGLSTMLFRWMGYLVFFIPVLLIYASTIAVGFRSSGKFLRMLFGSFVTIYFLFCIIHLMGPRISLNYDPFPGGRIASGIAIFLENSTGAVLAYLILLTAFITSLVILFNWDLVGDFQRILRKLKDLLGSLYSEGEPGEKSKPKRIKKPADPCINSETNPWARDGKSSVETDQLPFDFKAQKISSDISDSSTHLTGKQAIEKNFQLSAGQSRSIHTSGVSNVESPVSIFNDEDKQLKTGTYILPPHELLSAPSEVLKRHSRAELESRGRILVKKLADFEVSCEMAGFYPGPVITRYELRPGAGVKINRILGLADDLALAMKAKRIRILAPIPGKGAVGIEIPNTDPEIVYLRNVIDTMSSEKKGLEVALGKDLEGKPFIIDLCMMPHLLIAGATGSGKSVCIHSIITTILMRLSPFQVRLALIDPKMLELSIYQEIPHLWAPVVIEAKQAHYLLKALTVEMENRYRRLTKAGVRSLSEFNDMITERSEDERMPLILTVIDELADLMMVSASEAEQPITRLAQMGRAVGIHLVLATQRPSVDVITGLIKANFPARIAFNVQSKTDSRTVLDMNGAEKLLGRGDMLFLPSSSPEPVRVHGSFVSTEETRGVVEYWRKQPELPFEFELPVGGDGNIRKPGNIKLDDPLLEQAKQLVIKHQQGSVSLLQRRLRVGYSRAARLIDMLEQMGVVGPFQGSRARDVLIAPEIETFPERGESDSGEEKK